MNKIFAVLGVIILLLIVIIIIPHNTVSNTAINTYLITLKNVPEGNGMYQQLININLSYPYGINSNGSNILFKDGSNNTFLYAWIQSINATNLQVWIKNYNNSILIEMMILPSFENLFSSTGYLGEAPQLSSSYNLSNNALKVFGDGYFFTGTTFPNVLIIIGSATVIQDNGLSIYNNASNTYWWGAYLNVHYNNSKFELLFNAYYNNNGNTNPGALNGFSSDVGTNYAGLTAYAGSYYLNTFDGGNILSASFHMSNTNYNNYIFSLYNASSQGTGASLYYNGNYYNQTGAYSNFYGNSTYSNIELVTYNNSLFIHYVIPILKLPNGMPTFTIAPIGTAPNPLYLSNSFTISNILLMDGKVKL